MPDSPHSLLPTAGTSSPADEATCELLSRLAHEIRTPLGSILMLSDLVAMGIDEQQRTKIDRIGQAGREIREVLEQTVDLVKFRAGRREPLPSREILLEEIEEWVEELGGCVDGSGRSLEMSETGLRLGLEALVAAGSVSSTPARVTWTDSGLATHVPGLTEEWFEPFSKTAPRSVGLRLTRAREVLRHSGGDLAIRRNGADDGSSHAEIIVPPSAT